MFLMMLVVKLLFLFTALPEFWVPVAALPLWVSLAFDRRTAFLVSLVLAFVAASFLRFDLVLLTVILVRGMGASLLFRDRKHPRQMVPAGAVAGLFACGSYRAHRRLSRGASTSCAIWPGPARCSRELRPRAGAIALFRDGAERLLMVCATAPRSH
jgi:hypothetical protein